jgi:hypothetical protein
MGSERFKEQIEKTLRRKMAREKLGRPCRTRVLDLA